jgi:exopolysaccharide biosynthesis protein
MLVYYSTLRIQSRQIKFFLFLKRKQHRSKIEDFLSKKLNAKIGTGGKHLKLLKFIYYSIVLSCYCFVFSSLVLFQGPYPHVRDYVVNSLISTNHFREWVRPLSLYTLSVDDVLKKTQGMYVQNDPASNVVSVGENFTNIHDGSIQSETKVFKTFTAYVLTIRDPKRIFVEATQHLNEVGETVSEMARRTQSNAGINGGSFEDVGWRGTGGIPGGITVSDDKWITTTGDARTPIVGFTEFGALITGNYNESELRKMHVKNAVSFGPTLIQNSKPAFEGDGGWGYAPRSAIGQKEDGTVILIVTDGRFIHGANNLGASLKEMQSLMLSYHAVVAANLDGGSSSTLYYQGKLVNEPTDVLGERKIASSFLVKPEHN